MAAFNIGGKILSTIRHGQEHVQQVLNEHGIKIDFEDHPMPSGCLRTHDGTYVKINDAKIDRDGQVSGQTNDQYYMW